MNKVSIRFFNDREVRAVWETRLKNEGNELGSATTQMKLTAPDGRKRLTNEILQGLLSGRNLKYG